MTALERARLWRALAHLLESGLGLFQALDLLTLPEATKGALKSALAAGRPLASVLKDVPVSDFERALVKHGEASGSLAAVFAHLADYLDDLQEQSQRQRSQWLPLFLTVVAALWLLPLPGVVSGERSLWAFFTVSGLATVALWWLWQRLFSVLTVVSWQYALPWGKASRHGDFFKFLGMAYQAGLPLDQALYFSAQGTFPKHARAWQYAAQRGQSLETILATGDFSQSSLGLLFSAEVAGRLEETLPKAAASLRFIGQEQQQRFLVVARFLVYLLIAAVIAWQIIQFYRSYLGALP